MKGWKKIVLSAALIGAWAMIVVYGMEYMGSVNTEAAQTKQEEDKDRLTKKSGRSEVDLSRPLFQEKADPLAIFVADAFLWSTKADVAFVSQTDIKAGIDKGSITKSDLKKVLGKNREMCEVNIKGRKILTALQSNVDGNGTFLQTAGITYEVWEKQDGSKEIRHVKIDGRNLDETAEYTIVGMKETLFLRQDGVFEDGYVVESAELEDAYVMLYEYLMEALNGEITEESLQPGIRFISKDSKTIVSISEKQKELYQEDSYQLHAEVETDSGEIGVEWSSSNSRVAAVSKDGKVVGIGPGTAWITAEAKDGSGATATCRITVTGKYKIRYVCNGGENHVANPEVYIGSTVVQLKKPKKEDATFLGWYVDEACTIPITEVQGKNVTIYAAWQDR